MRNVLVPLVLTAALAAADSTSVLADADADLAAGRQKEAIEKLDAHLKEHPDDQAARRAWLAAKVASSEGEMRNLLREQAASRDMVVGDNDYETAKSLADTDVRRRLEVAEYLLSARREADAVETCNNILRDHPRHPAVLRLKYLTLQSMVGRERDRLEQDRRHQHDEAINDVIRRGSFPSEPARVARTVFDFDEDVRDAERAAVRQKLQASTDLNADGIAVRPIIEKLFAIAGINYVIVDSAVGEEKLTVRLQDVTVEDALDTISHLVKIRYSYKRNTVFITGADTEADVLVTEIIRLRAGLTDVSAAVSSSSLGGPTQVPGAPPGQGGIGGGNVGSPTPPGDTGPGDAPGSGKTDIEKLLEQVPELVVGWPESGKIYLDRKSNTVYVRATPAAIAEVKRLLAGVDYDNAQVLIEARFLEIEEKALFQLGVAWEGANSTNPANRTVAGTIGGAAARPTALVPNGGGVVSGLISNDRFSLLASLKALEEQGRSKTMAEPKILTLNNATGQIEVSSEVVYINGYQNQGQGQIPVVTNGVTTYVQQTALVPTFAKEKEGISLSITPSIARNSDIITLRLTPKIVEIISEIPLKEIEFNLTGGDGQAVSNKITVPPEFSTRSLTTTLHVQNGRTVALGGLIKEKNTESRAGLPWFSRMPLLGWMFREDNKSDNRKHLIILVTANLVEPSGSKLTDDVQRLRDTARVMLPEVSLVPHDIEVPATTPEDGAEAVPARNPNLDDPKRRGGR